MTFRPEPPTDYDSSAERLIYAVAEQIDTDPLELPPLYDTIDPELLDAFLAKWDGGPNDFQYAGLSVRIESNGAIHLAEDGVP